MRPIVKVFSVAPGSFGPSGAGGFTDWQWELHQPNPFHDDPSASRGGNNMDFVQSVVQGRSRSTGITMLLLSGKGGTPQGQPFVPVFLFDGRFGETKGWGSSPYPVVCSTLVRSYSRLTFAANTSPLRRRWKPPKRSGSDGAPPATHVSKGVRDPVYCCQAVPAVFATLSKTSPTRPSGRALVLLGTKAQGEGKRSKAVFRE